MMLHPIFEGKQLYGETGAGNKKPVEDPAPWRTGSCQFLPELRALRQIPQPVWTDPALVCLSTYHRQKRESRRDGPRSDHSRMDSILTRLVPRPSAKSIRPR